MSGPLRISGLILAAGRSRRMGALKQTLPWPTLPATVVSSSFDAIAPCCERMFVVVGDDAQSIHAALGERAFVRVLGDSGSPMFDSIRAGLRAILGDRSLGGDACDAVMLQPGDHPAVERSTIEALLAEHRRDSAVAVMPIYRGKGGHPVLIPAVIALRIVDYGGHGGLRQFWIDHPNLCRRVATDDQTCVLDLDTPEQYRAAISGLERGSPQF